MRKFLVFFLSLTVSIAPVAHANGEGIIACEDLVVDELSLKNVLIGHRLYPGSQKNGHLDATTITNLEIDKFVLKPLTDLAPTSLGRQRIQYLVQNPSLDVQHILDRQNALSELLQHPEGVSSIHQAMRSVESSDACLTDLDKWLQPGADHHTSGEFLLMSYLLTGMMCGTGLAGILLSLLSGQREGAMAGMMMGQFVLYGYLLPFMLKNNPTYAATRNVFVMGPRLAEKLKNSQSRELQRIVQILGWPESEDDPLETKTISRILRRTSPEGLSKVAQNLTLTRMILKSLGVKKLVRLKQNLAVYFSAWAELETYVTAGMFSEKHRQHLSMPTIVQSDSSELSIEDGHHPYQVLKESLESTPNDLSMSMSSEHVDENTRKTFVLTGPNAGGKTTYMRMISLNILLAQMGFPVTARSMSLTPMHLVTNFAVIDSTELGASTFMSQAMRVAEILERLARGEKVFVALDEILTGTSHLEHRSGEQTTLDFIHSSPSSLAILATHDRTMTEFIEAYPNAGNKHVSLEGFHILPGPSSDYNATDVGARAGLPKEFIQAWEERLSALRAAEKQ